MVVLFWSAKGGSGVTVVTAAAALVSARHRATVLIDLGGDSLAALGMPDLIGPGVLDWLGAPNATAERLFRLAADASDGLRVVGAGTGSGDAIDPAAWERLASACASCRDTVLVDAGRLVPPRVMHDIAARSLLVTRPCFLALRCGARHSNLASGAVLVTEPGRALTAGDVKRALSVPVEAEVSWDPAVARAVDAGLLASRVPHVLLRQLRHLTPQSAA
jgi:hypothetical protein